MTIKEKNERLGALIRNAVKDKRLKPRRLNGNQPESDRDFMENNADFVIAILKALESPRRK